MNRFPSREVVERLRQQYPKGTCVKRKTYIDTKCTR